MPEQPDPNAASVHSVGGRKFLVRPIRPDDAPALAEGFRRSDVEDRRMRFFVPFPELPEAMVRRFTRIDPRREMAFVATEPAVDPRAICGVVRLVNDATDRAAEYAIMVRSDLKGTGLGRLLMRIILDCAAARGLREVFGDVLAENRAMLRMARRLGGTVERRGDDFSVLHVRFDLAAREEPRQGGRIRHDGRALQVSGVRRDGAMDLQMQLVEAIREELERQAANSAGALTIGPPSDGKYPVSGPIDLEAIAMVVAGAVAGGP